MPDDNHPLMPRRNHEDIDFGAIKADLEFLIERVERPRANQLKSQICGPADRGGQIKGLRQNPSSPFWHSPKKVSRTNRVRIASVLGPESLLPPHG